MDNLKQPTFSTASINPGIHASVYPRELNDTSWGEID